MLTSKSIILFCGCIIAVLFFLLLIKMFTRKPLSREQFTELIWSAMAKKLPYEVEIVESMHLKMIIPNKDDSHYYLDNVYQQYLKDLDDLDRLTQIMIDGCLERLDADKEIKLEQILPTIKPQNWLEPDNMASLRDRVAFDALNTELLIVYALDLKYSMRYIYNEDLEKINFHRKELFARAVENLEKLMGKIYLAGENGIFFFISDNSDYIASLILLKDIWNFEKLKVNGDVIFAVPNREMLVISGSDENIEVFNQIKEIVRKAYAESGYKISDKIFCFKNGKIEIFQH